eukprot:c20740_g3_i2.p1 GENE.c20740_g3_i2~~c20740_g3_i2.p1  ORF type:complete len:167 (-),score=34.84 c20740_g3_i2:49-549(-)
MAGMGSQKRSYDQMLESSQAAEAAMRDANLELDQLGSASGTEPEGDAPMEEEDEYASVRHSFVLPPFGFLKPRRLGRGVLPELKKPIGIAHKDLLTFLEREHQVCGFFVWSLLPSVRCVSDCNPASNRFVCVFVRSRRSRNIYSKVTCRLDSSGEVWRSEVLCDCG